MSPEDLCARLETRLRALQADHVQQVAQANAIAGAITLCQQLLAELTAPPTDGAPKEDARGE